MEQQLLAATCTAATHSDLATKARAPRTRAALNAWHLSDDGRARLTTMLDDGDYTLAHPENAVLLVVAWLVRAGDHVGDDPGSLPAALRSALTDLGVACSGTMPAARPILGWSNGPHPLLAGS